MPVVGWIVAWLIEHALDWLMKRRHLQQEVDREVALQRMPATKAALDWKIAQLEHPSDDIGLRQQPDTKLDLSP